MTEQKDAVAEQPNAARAEEPLLNGCETLSLGFRLREASSYFTASQPQPSTSSSTESSVKQDPGIGCAVEQLQTLDIAVSSNIKKSEDYEKLGLTGNVISAVGHIPYRVVIANDGKLELAPKVGKSTLHEALSHLSSSSTWKHTIVGWTGEVLPASSAEIAKTFRWKELLPEYQAALSRRLKNDLIPVVEGSGLEEAFVQLLNNIEFDKQTLINEDRRRELETLLIHACSDKIVPVWMGDWSADDGNGTLMLGHQARWSKYEEDELYPNLLHLELPPEDEELPGQEDRTQAFADYRRINESTADAIMKIYQPGDIIWVHDYQLMLLPEILRTRLPSAYIAYYHHTICCPRELLLDLPEQREIMNGVIGASVIGMPSRGIAGYVEDYYRFVANLSGTGDYVITVGGRHISLIDVAIGSYLAAVRKTAPQNDRVDYYLPKLRKRFDKKIVIARPQVDKPSMRFLLDGIQYFLEHYSEWQHGVVFFLFTTLDTLEHAEQAPTETSIDGETELRVENMNNQFKSSTYQPIVLVARYGSAAELCALLRLADMCIVSSNHESVDTVSTDFVVSQQEKASSLFIMEHLSTNDDSKAPGTEGSSAEILASKIADGLNMEESEKRQNHHDLLDYFSKDNVATFTDEFLTKACAAFAKYCPCENAPTLNQNTLVEQYRVAQKRLLMFDFDGTLTPIVNDPDKATPTENCITALSKLASNDRNKVWLISGRSRAFLTSQFGEIGGLGLSAEHGSFVRRPGSGVWENLAASMDMGWKVEATKAFERLTEKIDGSWIEHKEVAIVWHYRNALNHEACLVKAAETKALLEGERLKGWDVEVMLGKANLEVRPKFLNKGSMAKTLMKETFGTEEEGFVLCAGDDTTDEGKFCAVSTTETRLLILDRYVPSLALE